MTRDQVQSVQDDIAYMKALAQEGRQGPLLGGSVLVAAAVIFGAATVGQWMMELGRIPNGGWESLSLWLSAAVVFVIVLVVLIRRIESACAGASGMNRSVGAAWSAIGYGIFVTWVALMVFGWRTGEWSVMALMPTVVMGAYGSAWMVVAAISRKAWLNIVGLTSYLGAVVLAGLGDALLIYPVYLALLIAVALVPGLVLVRGAARKAG